VVGLEILDQEDFWGVGHIAESLAQTPKKAATDSGETRKSK
jgi:hypothetical protein